MVYDEDLDTDITISPHPTIKEFVKTFSIHRTTVEIRIHMFDFITQFDQWVSQQLITRKRKERVGTCVFFFNLRNNREPFLNHIVTSDEKTSNVP